MFSVICRCNQVVAVRPSSCGSRLRCPHCGRFFDVPSLSVLKRYRERNEAAPSVPEPSVPEAGVPERESEVEATRDQPRGKPDRLVAHCWGEVGPTGRVSSTAMENYVGLVIRALDAFLSEHRGGEAFQLLLSCAILPDRQSVIQLQSLPAEAAASWGDTLRERIAALPKPSVVDGPVAFVCYRSVDGGPVDHIALVPFADLQTAIDRVGFDAALMQAGNLAVESPTTAAKASWWRRVLEFLASKARQRSQARPVATPREIHEQLNRWVDQAEAEFSNRSLELASAKVTQDAEDLKSLIGLAAHRASSGDTEGAIDSYTRALKLAPDCAPLIGRRGWNHFVADNHRAALADYNRAIELAPFDPFYYFFRSQIFAGLEAWPQVIADLDEAHRLAPREPTFLLPRAECLAFTGELQPAKETLSDLLALDPNCGAAHAMLGWMHQQPELLDLELSLRHLTMAIDLMPDDSTPRVHRSLAYASQNKFELALLDCDWLVQRQPEAPAAHGVRGRILQMQGEFEPAIEACSKAIDLGLEAASVFVARGVAYAALDQSELALADCDAALAIDADNPLALHLRGTLSMQRGELDAAMDAFTQARQIAPDWPEPREQIALLHRMNENPQAAVEEQDILVANQPNQPAHYVNRAFAYTQLGEYDRAKDDYQRACELDPENEQIYFLRGCFLLDRQEQHAALADFNRVLEIAGDHDDARLRRAAILLQLKRQHEALEDYAALIAKHPDDPQAYTGRALAHQIIGDEQAADADIDRAMEIAPEMSTDLTIQMLHGKVGRLEREGKYEEAIAAAEEVIQIAPDRAEGYRLRGWIRWYTEQHVEACEDYTRLLEIEPEDPGVLSSRGQIYAEMGEFDAALVDLNAAVALSREAGLTQVLAFALNGRALAHAGLRQWDASNRDYEESVKLCPANAWAHYHRGVVLYQQGDREQAQQRLQQALELDEPPLTDRKADRARAVLRRIEADQA